VLVDPPPPLEIRGLPDAAPRLGEPSVLQETGDEEEGLETDGSDLAEGASGATADARATAGGAAAGPVSGYSPITDQRKPIMMKNPTKRAMSPSPPYGEFAPSWGTS
jgi:hypothetical protein